MKRKLLWAGAALLLVLAIAYVILVRTTASADNCTFTLDLPGARALANSLPGAKPHEIRVDRLATFKFPEAIISAGQPWHLTEMRDYAFELGFADGTHIIIDTGMSENQAKAAHAEDYDSAAWARVSKGMLLASAIYVTHEHGDHLGGLLADESLAPAWAHAHITKEQLDDPDRLKPIVMSEAQKHALVPLEYGQQLAVAPGVVLIKAPGHTPGSQMVFVSRDDGTELLIIGDTAWHVVNIDSMRGPPRLATLLLHNDPVANACQLAALHAAASDPKLHMMPGHDGERMQALVDAGVVTMGFR